ncbi:MAG: FecR family protein [Treponema sp.]|nr:FecR family protein [Treponema sp.]
MKKNTKFRVIDPIIILLCLSGAVASGMAFWREYNHTLLKVNEDPVGIIIFKKNTAQRRFIDRVVWDRLRDTSPVYNGDTIRTIEQSIATIAFRDEITSLNLDENTLIQIFWTDKEGAKIDFTGGNLEVLSGSKGVIISGGVSEIKVEGQANLNKSEEGFSLSVLEGQANIDGKEIDAGNILAVDNRGEINTSPMIAMTSFGASARIIGVPSGTAPINFSWNAFHFNPDTRVIVEVARDKGFRRMAVTREVSGASSISVPLENGNYWWRAYPVNSGSKEPANKIFPSGTLEIIPAVPVVLLTPARTAQLSFSGESSVSFSWTAAEGAAAYHLEISSRADMSAPIVNRQVQENSITRTGLENGRWYWRVTPIFSEWIRGSIPPSAIGDFTVSQHNVPPSEPVLTFPAQNGTLYLDSSSRRLLWTHDPGVSSWLVEMAENPRMTNLRVKQTVNSNFYSLPPEQLQAGKTWYWRISATGSGGTTVSAARNFTVASGSPPSAAPVLAAAPPAPPAVVVPVPPPVEAPPPPRVLAAPVLTLPSQDGIIFLDASDRRLMWVNDPNAASWQVEMADNQRMVNPVVRQNVNSNSFSLPREVLQEEKTWYWRVTALGGASPVVSVVRNFEIRAAIKPPDPPPEPPPAAVDPLRHLTQISGTGTVTGILPPDGYSITTGQLANTPSINFIWQGKSPEYRFALYRANGEMVFPPSSVTSSAFTLTNPGILTAGAYVWQIFEKDGQGNWGLPSTANRLIVTQGSANIRTLTTQNPGVLYGKP